MKKCPQCKENLKSLETLTKYEEVRIVGFIERKNIETGLIESSDVTRSTPIGRRILSKQTYCQNCLAEIEEKDLIALPGEVEETEEEKKTSVKFTETLDHVKMRIGKKAIVPKDIKYCQHCDESRILTEEEAMRNKCPVCNNEL